MFAIPQRDLGSTLTRDTRRGERDGARGREVCGNEEDREVARGRLHGRSDTASMESRKHESLQGRSEQARG